MTKNYQVSVDITCQKTLFVEANNEEEAKTIVNNYISDDPFYYIRKADSYLEHNITDVSETNEK